eukprot:4396105-Amphidinium_carterae.1
MGSVVAATLLGEHAQQGGSLLSTPLEMVVMKQLDSGKMVWRLGAFNEEVIALFCTHARIPTMTPQEHTGINTFINSLGAQTMGW